MYWFELLGNSVEDGLIMFNYKIYVNWHSPVNGWMVILGGGPRNQDMGYKCFVHMMICEFIRRSLENGSTHKLK